MFGEEGDAQRTVLLISRGLFIDHGDPVEPSLVLVETIEREVQAALYTSGKGKRCIGLVHCRDVWIEQAIRPTKPARHAVE